MDNVINKDSAIIKLLPYYLLDGSDCYHLISFIKLNSEIEI